jgi:perosamine synthetase
MIPIYKPFLNGNEKEYVNECLDSTWISSKGDFIKKFEDGIKRYVGSNYASSCSNGTTALDLAFKAINVQQGDEIITASFTYVASTNAILINGAVPVFIDIEKDSWNLDADLIEQKITVKTKAILISNIYGYLPNVEYIRLLCEKFNIFLIEDAAESLGASFDGVKSGTFGHISTFSFFGNKTITTGEGGMVLTNDKKLYDKVEVLKNQGNSKTRTYFHDVLGYNYRMTNIQAAIGLAQLEQLDLILSKKAKIYNYYFDKLSQYLTFQKPINRKVTPSYWIVTVLFSDLKQKERVQEGLIKNKIEFRPLFYPVDELDFYEKDEYLEITKRLYNRGICLPSFPSLSEQELNKICCIIIENL